MSHAMRGRGACECGGGDFLGGESFAGCAVGAAGAPHGDVASVFDEFGCAAQEGAEFFGHAAVEGFAVCDGVDELFDVVGPRGASPWSGNSG